MAVNIALVAFLSICLSSATVYPKVKGEAQVLGIATDPSLDRDSCGSVKFNTRALWVCRDTQPVGPDGLPNFPVFTSSASWSDFNKDGTPGLTPINPKENTSTIDVDDELLLYGKNHEKAFYPLQYNECNDNQAGECGDGSRYALWPDSPPLVSVINADGSIVAYTWIRQSHITADLGTLVPDPPATLYRVDYMPEGATKTELPQVEVVNETFWGENEIAYGDYGNLMRNGTAYLYGQPSTGIVALAKVPALDIEDKSQYQYWVDGAWTLQQPSMNASGINLNNTAGGQGTFYFSEPWQSYVWIGGPNGLGADFYVTTAPEPYGPWTTPELFYQGISGNYSLGAYSLQAHPALLANPQYNEIYISWTKNDIVDNVNVYTQPLVLVQWK